MYVLPDSRDVLGLTDSTLADKKKVAEGRGHDSDDSDRPKKKSAAASKSKKR